MSLTVENRAKHTRPIWDWTELDDDVRYNGLTILFVCRFL